MEGLEYANTYSRKVWEVLMSRFRKDESYQIGANDVSDFVLNAILDALNGMRPPHFPEDNKAEVSEDVKQTPCLGNER